MSDTPFNTIEEAITAIQAGEMVVVVDDDDRENEGDLIMAASKATPEAVAFMIRHTSGILCAPLFEDHQGAAIDCAHITSTWDLKRGAFAVFAGSFNLCRLTLRHAV